ncbi:MAG: hypothetical protein WAQ07_06170 [Candidatus Omnitrophota bacterium]
MTSYYIYLISSLPELRFGDKPPFSLEEFLNICSRAISDKDLERLIKELTSLYGSIDKGLLPRLKEWRRFNRSLRNELVKLRAKRKNEEALKYLRADDNPFTPATHTALLAYRNRNILDAEKFLDLERWRFLDGLSCGHYFDIILLVIYALKLKILLRWDNVYASDKDRLLEEALK